MVPILMLDQILLTPEEIHAEDAKVIEASLVRYWKLDQPGSFTVRVLDRTLGPFSLKEVAIRRNGNPILGIEPSIQRSFAARNKTSGSIEWFRPKTRNLQLVPLTSRDHPYGPDSFARQHSWLLFPAYSANRSQAIFCFGFNVGYHSPGRATIWLTKSKGQWQVTRQEDWIIY